MVVQGTVARGKVHDGDAITKELDFPMQGPWDIQFQENPFLASRSAGKTPISAMNAAAQRTVAQFAIEVWTLGLHHGEVPHESLPIGLILGIELRHIFDQALP